ncbi:MAG: C69 family dipeptidase [Acidobacteriota bacterium]
MSFKLINITLLIFYVILFFGSNELFSCTSVLVTKGASTDGSTMISYSCDGEFHPHLRMTPAADFKPGETIELRNWYGKKGKIPQVAHTYKVVGLMNEFQLAIGETTFEGRLELVNKDGLFNYFSLMKIALQRAKTAREAIKVMTSLVEKYGYGSSGESFSIADKKEVWIMEMVGTGKGGSGAVWVAIKIPDGYISAHANMSRIGEFSLNDPNVIFSKNVISFAKKKGYYDPARDGKFNFSKVYNPPSEEQVKYSLRRVWSIFRRSAPSKKLSPDFSSSIKGAEPYPLFIKPDKKLNVRDVISLHRDHYEGTKFDMTGDLTAGPFGAPDRWRPMKWEVDGKMYAWERPISTQQAAYVFVSQSRSFIPDQIGGIYWYGMDNPYTNFFIPLYTSILKLPESYTRGALKKFSRDSAWWAFNFVANYANLRWSYMIKDIKKVQKEIEDSEFDMQPVVEDIAKKLLNENKEGLLSQYLTDYCVENGEKNIKKWWKLSEFLITKYNDGYIQNEKNRPREIGYPEKWLKNEIKNNRSKFRLKMERKGKGEL